MIYISSKKQNDAVYCLYRTGASPLHCTIKEVIKTTQAALTLLNFIYSWCRKHFARHKRTGPLKPFIVFTEYSSFFGPLCYLLFSVSCVFYNK